MRTSDQVIVASFRWLNLLRRSNATQAWALIGNDPRYMDLSRTQYYAGLEWLLDRGLLVEFEGSVALGSRTRGVSSNDLGAEVMALALELDRPAWLMNADELVSEPSDLPQDAESLAEGLGLSQDRAFQVIRRAQYKVDLEARARVGALGELALLNALEQRWPAAATHVSVLDDSAGYDIGLCLPDADTHIEVKTTGRRGRLVIYVSRHEYETGQRDPAWRLVVVGLDRDDRLDALATVRAEVLRARAPADVDLRTAWDSARFSLDAVDLEPGFQPVGATIGLPSTEGTDFAWMPARRDSALGQATASKP